MTFDLLSTVGITASAAVVVATYVALFGSSLTQRVTIGAAMALWFIGVLWIGVPGNISTPLLLFTGTKQTNNEHANNQGAPAGSRAACCAEKERENDETQATQAAQGATLF